MIKMRDMIDFAQRAVRIRSYSDEEGPFAEMIAEEMKCLGYDEVRIDSTGNVVGRIGNSGPIIHFDSHMDTVQVSDPQEWSFPPFSGEIAGGFLLGRGSVDMKSGLSASLYGAALAKEKGLTEGKTVYVSTTVCEEYCDGVNLRHLYEECSLKPDFCIICEPSGNKITLGHKGKAQILLSTKGISAHGSAPEKGVNAVYEMAEIILRVEALNKKLSQREGQHGTIVLSDISSVSASLNAVPSECSIYLDRRLALGESVEQVKKEMDALIEGKQAFWKPGTLIRRSWTGRELVYEPLHDPWQIERNHPLTRALIAACESVQKKSPETFDFWDFGTNAIIPVEMGVPTIGFGPGEYKLAHMTDERCLVSQIEEACEVYCELIRQIGNQNFQRRSLPKKQ